MHCECNTFQTQVQLNGSEPRMRVGERSRFLWSTACLLILLFLHYPSSQHSTLMVKALVPLNTLSQSTQNIVTAIFKCIHSLSVCVPLLCTNTQGDDATASTLLLALNDPVTVHHGNWIHEKGVKLQNPSSSAFVKNCVSTTDFAPI